MGHIRNSRDVRRHGCGRIPHRPNRAFIREDPGEDATKNKAVIRLYTVAGNVIETHEHKGEFKEP
jgi:hypothetical protein